MGVDTKAFIKSDVDGIYSFIKRAFDSDAIFEPSGFSNDYNIIIFSFGKERRRLNCHNMRFGGVFVEKEEEWYYNEYQTREESQSYVLNKYEGIPDKTKGINLSLGYGGSSVEIMKAFANEFGGWIDESDSDAIGHERVKKKTARRDIIRAIFTKADNSRR